MRWCAGLVFGIGAIASPWLLTYVDPAAIEAFRAQQFTLFRQPWNVRGLTMPDRITDVTAIAWVALVGLACVGVPPGLRYARTKLTSRRAETVVLASTIVIVAVLVAWPWFVSRNRDMIWFGLGGTVVVASVLTRLRRPTSVLMFGAALVGAALLLCADLFRGSDAWWACGWKYGTIHWPWMIMGTTSNLPGILRERYGWQSPETPVELFNIPASVLFGYPKAVVTLTIKNVLMTTYVVTLVLSAIGIGLHARRRDRRVLVAFAAPWLMFFCFPTQIHERYLLYAAGVASVAIGAGAGPMLLGVLLTAITWVMTMHVMLNHGDRSEFGRMLSEQFPRLLTPDAGNTLHRFIVGTFPDIGWAVLLTAGIYLYLSLAPSRARDTTKPTA
jgi:hypothetical protein